MSEKRKAGESQLSSGENNDSNNNGSMRGITDPRETDVLCGRGGAALRHPGNQTYRRLVNLNKQLYITCLKTEKLKISRSIVAAIREQNGRFLERESKKQTWYDIGDKKAIEKTSQALREGQPKLRQKMIDNGQLPANHGNDMETQFGNGVYQPNQSSNNATHRTPSFGAASISSSGIGSGLYPSDISQFSMSSITGPSAMQLPTSFQGNNSSQVMPPPPTRTSSIGNNSNNNNQNHNQNADMLMQRLSLTSMGQPQPQSIPSWTPSIGSMDTDRSFRSRMRPSLQQGGSAMADAFGFGPDHRGSMMSEFSAISSMNGNGNNNSNNNNNNINLQNYQNNNNSNLNHFANGVGMNNNNNQNMRQNSFNHPGMVFANNNLPPSGSNMMSPLGQSSHDRRRLFAKMKLARQSAAGRNPTQRPDIDGMPDIHMVDSTFSLLSNLSGHGNSKHGGRSAVGIDSMNISGHGGSGLSGFSNHGLSNHSGHESMFADAGLGSRRSLMSGLSKISDHSNSGSVFSDLSKKIGLPPSSMSNRSIAMSEVSGIDEEDESDDEEFAYDLASPTPRTEES